MSIDLHSWANSSSFTSFPYSITPPLPLPLPFVVQRFLTRIPTALSLPRVCHPQSPVRDRNPSAKKACKTPRRVLPFRAPPPGRPGGGARKGNTRRGVLHAFFALGLRSRTGDCGWQTRGKDSAVGIRVRKRCTTNGRGSGSGGVMEYGNDVKEEELAHEWRSMDTNGNGRRAAQVGRWCRRSMKSVMRRGVGF